MSEDVLAQIMALAEQLTPEEQATLKERLENSPKVPKRNIVSLEGAFLPYLEGPFEDFDSEAWLKAEHCKSMERLYRCV